MQRIKPAVTEGSDTLSIETAPAKETKENKDHCLG